jgi:hypothetical protein
MAEIFGQKVLKEIQPKTSNPNRVLKKVQSWTKNASNRSVWIYIYIIFLLGIGKLLYIMHIHILSFIQFSIISFFWNLQHFSHTHYISTSLFRKKWNSIIAKHHSAYAKNTRKTHILIKNQWIQKKKITNDCHKIFMLKSNENSFLIVW